MIYTLKEILHKMGAPDVRESGGIEWFYFDTAAKKNKDLAGRAAIRLEAGGARLVATLHHARENTVDDNGKDTGPCTELFHLIAERTAQPEHYRIVTLSLDGETYDDPQKPVIELGLSVFHARALDISIAMTEQAFNKQDILDPVIDPRSQFRQFEKTAAPEKKKQPASRKPTQKKPASAPVQNGIVIPFPARPGMAANA